MPLRTNLVFWLLTLLVLVGAILSISERSKVTEEVSSKRYLKIWKINFKMYTNFYKK